MKKVPALGWAEKLAPSRPAIIASSTMPSVSRAIWPARCITASVRSSAEPGGSWTTPIRKPWSCSGMKPVGVSVSRQPVRPSRPAYSTIMTRTERTSRAVSRP
jgi:hypothetical protein